MMAISIEEARQRQQEGPPDLATFALDWAALADKTPPLRRWAWADWIPAGTVTLLHGYGGIGKTLLAQQLATAYALGQPLFGGVTAGGKALLLAGEDDAAEIWRRQVDICTRFEVDLEDIAETLDILPVPHIDITLAQAEPSGRLQTTPMLQGLRDRIDDLRPGLVILDNSAKLFAFSENDRAHVTRGIRLLQELCHDFDTTLLLLAHNNKVGDHSGSTAWENAVRSRLSMTRDSEDKETIILARPKANYADNGQVALRWDRGSFRGESPGAQSEVERIAAENRRQAVEAAVLAFVRERNQQGRPVSHAKNVHNYLPRVMTDTEYTSKEIERAMERLFDSGGILAGQPIVRGSDRKFKVGIACAEAHGEEAV
jgi:RecA-family ATPase